MRLDSMPYLEAPRYNKMFTGIDGQPQRRYYLYSEAGGGKPTAAIVVDAPDDAVWAVAIMGSVRAGHGKKALGELGRIAFEGRKRHRVLVRRFLRSKCCLLSSLDTFFRCVAKTDPAAGTGGAAGCDTEGAEARRVLRTLWRSELRQHVRRRIHQGWE
jgi:hypothetical protein